MNDNVNDSAELWKSIDRQIQSEPVELGRYTSDDYMNDIKHIAFVASRYKFCAKMLEGRETVMEIGCGDGFGAPFVASVVKKLICTDINPPLLDDIRRRHGFLKNTSYEFFEFRENAYRPKVDGIFLVDVIEHIFPSEEDSFMANISASLNEQGVALIGTPNKSAEQYASSWSRQGHVNLKTHQSLREMCAYYFHNVFMFGMNDEVLHTGYGPMCHFLWALCVIPRQR
jgi:cyclopropane fatty-acyl-phospholipid synthase-like methyltransferase